MSAITRGLQFTRSEWSKPRSVAALPIPSRLVRAIRRLIGIDAPVASVPPRVVDKRQVFRIHDVDAIASALRDREARFND